MVGVGTGVVWFDDVVADPDCAFGGGTSPLYTSPSSPGEKERLEQKPSEDEIINVRPSLDLLQVSKYCENKVMADCTKRDQ